MGNIIEKNNTLLERALVYKDQDAFVKLFNCNEHLIHSYIKEGLGLKNDNIHKDIYKEYYSVGKFSLIKAIKKFPLEYIGRVDFESYAKGCIEKGITNYINSEWKAKDRFNCLSLEEVSEEEASSDMYNPQVILEDKEFDEYKKERIEEALLVLKEKEVDAVRLYYGFNDDKKYTIEEVAKIMNISKSYTEKLLISGRNKLREELSDLKANYRETNNKKKICKLS